jgi:hypothetical protein
LESVKQLLRDNTEKLTELGFSTDELNIDALTDGAALSATQAALWTYANKSYINGTTDEFTFNTINYTDADLPAAEALYNLLISMADESAKDTTTETQTTTPVLNTDTFATDATITLKHKVETSQEGETVEAAEQSDVYDTDLSFSIKIQPNNITDSYLLTVLQDGQPIKVYNLKDDYDTLNGTATKDSVNFTITDIELPEGATVTLNLTGLQNIDKGVYVFMGSYADISTNSPSYVKDSQTFIGIAEGTQKVNLSVDLTFNVEEPELQVESTTESTSGSAKDATYKVETTSKVTVDEDSTVNNKL